jgi:hypothetical protein
MFESVVQRCMAEGLVGADGFAVDASLIAADANKQRSVASKDWKLEEVKANAVRAAQEYLATLDDAAFGAASPVTPKFISRSDPAAQWTGAHKKRRHRSWCRIGRLAECHAGDERDRRRTGNIVSRCPSCVVRGSSLQGPRPRLLLPWLCKRGSPHL